MIERMKYAALNDNQIQERISARDQRAIEYVYRSNYRMIESMVRKYNTEIDAQDIYQEAMMVLLNTLYDRTLTCKISTFLFSVARNMVLKQLRDKPVLDVADIVEVREESESYSEYSERRETLIAALNLLGEKCRSILERYYFRSESMEEIAVALEYTNAANVKNQKYKCMKQLKERMHG